MMIFSCWQSHNLLKVAGPTMRPQSSAVERGLLHLSSSSTCLLASSLTLPQPLSSPQAVFQQTLIIARVVKVQMESPRWYSRWWGKSGRGHKYVQQFSIGQYQCLFHAENWCNLDNFLKLIIDRMDAVTAALSPVGHILYCIGNTIYLYYIYSILYISSSPPTWHWCCLLLMNRPMSHLVSFPPTILSLPACL